MKRWIAGALSLFLGLGALAGCSQKCFISEKAFYDAHSLPTGLEDGDHTALIHPSKNALPAPPNVDQPDRIPRPISLQEAFAIALESGGGSSRGGINTQGTVDDTPLAFNGGPLNNQSDRFRVLALQPAVSAANIEAAISRFDALYVTSMNWSSTDQLPQFQTSFTNGTRSNFTSAIVKGLPGGGVASTSLEVDYTLLDNPPAGAGVINPNYATRLRFGFEQPLWRNFGSDINQLLTRLAPITGGTLPGPVASAFNAQQSNLTSVAGQPLEGILLTRLRFDQSRAEFERQTHNLLLNVEVAYWRLYQAYGQLYSNEEVLRILHKTWIVNYYQVQAGKIPPDNLYQIRGQYEEFRGERTNALGAVLEAERNLRGILGLPVEDGCRLIPVTPPTLAPYQPDWEAALCDAMNLRPELVLARENLRFQQLVLIREKNLLKPDLRFAASYSPLGFGTQLDGDGTFVDATQVTRTSNSFRSLAQGDFGEYNLGLTLSVPLGRRFEFASTRSARLQLAQSYYVLKDQEERVQRTLAQQYQELTKWYRLIESRRAERRAYAESVEKRFKLLEVGTKVANLELLDAQRRLALALNKEYQAIAEYNNTLARLEFAKGTILNHSNVVIAEGPLTPCAQVRAVEHERERTRAFVLREKPDPMAHPSLLAVDPNLPVDLEKAPLPEPPLDTSRGEPAKAGPSKTEPKVAAPIADKGKVLPTSDLQPPLVPEAPAYKANPAAKPAASSGWKEAPPPTKTVQPTEALTLPPPMPLPDILSTMPAADPQPSKKSAPAPKFETPLPSLPPMPPLGDFSGQPESRPTPTVEPALPPAIQPALPPATAVPNVSDTNAPPPPPVLPTVTMPPPPLP